MMQSMVLADPYSDAVECIGMIHSSKKVWDRAMALVLTKLGIQQARLLAWGDFVGICSRLDDKRDPRLDSEDTKQIIQQTLKGIIALIKPADQKHHLDTYGLKAIKRSIGELEPAMDFARMEVFRDQFSRLTPTARSPKVSGSHWAIQDLHKPDALVIQLQAHIDSLIALFDLEARVSTAVKSDIRALAWHPVFDNIKAASDGQKLRLIRDVCEDVYPSYAVTADEALAYLNKEWNDSHEEAMERMSIAVRDSPVKKKLTAKEKGAKAFADAEAKRAKSNAKAAEMYAMSQVRTAKKVIEESHGHLPHEKAKWEKEGEKRTQSPKPTKQKRRSIFGLPIKAPSWRGKSKKETVSDDDTPRALSASAAEKDDNEDGGRLMPARSRSLFVSPKSDMSAFGQSKTVSNEKANGEPDLDSLAEKDGEGSVDHLPHIESMASIKSMISRHDFNDYGRASIR